MYTRLRSAHHRFNRIGVDAIVWAVGPGAGQKTIRTGINGLGGSSCYEESVTAKWDLDSLMGEPLVSGSWKWTGSGDCDADPSTVVWLRLQYGDAYGFVRLSPVVPDVNDGYGFNTPESPDWDELVCGYNGSQRTECFSEKGAKTMWKQGTIVSFDIAWDN